MLTEEETMMFHCCQSVRGALLKSDEDLEKTFKNSITGECKILKTAYEIRDFFMDHLSEGHEVIPLGDPCEGFDYKKGCQGHESLPPSDNEKKE